ncbi:MAG TPA: hypothetical protein VH393_12235 [Ktedonobacterales bacterium]|jgi:hypothetical protein
MNPVNPEALEPLDRELIAALGLDLASIQVIEPMPSGLGGGRLLRLMVEHRTGMATWREWLVVKTLLPADGWLGVTSQDSRLREIQLWERGLLQSLPANIATGVRNWALLGNPDHPTAGALLMDDLISHLLRDPYHPPPGRLPPSMVALLECLAELHARYWQDGRLCDPTLGLMAPRDALLLISPESVRARLAMGDANSYLPLAEQGWEAFFRLAPPNAAERLRAILVDPEPIARVIVTLPQALVHGDMWGPNLGWLPATKSAPRRKRQLLLLDWALALTGPATYDPLWLCGGWHALDPRRILACYQMFLERYLRTHGVSLSPTTWLALVDAGYLRTTLTCGEAFGRAAAEAPAGHARAIAEARVHWWAERAAQATDRLLAGYPSSRVSA